MIFLKKTKKQEEEKRYIMLILEILCEVSQ